MKLRSGAPVLSASIEFDINDKTTAKIKLFEPTINIAKGQVCAIYNENNQLLGGGYIT